MTGFPGAGLDGWQRNDVDVPTLVVSGADSARALPDAPFRQVGLRPVFASGIDEAKTRFTELRPRIVILPLAVDGAPSTPFLQRVLARKPAPVVVVIASNDEINTAAEAMRIGAHDCLFRPFSPMRLAKALENALRALPPQSSPAPGQRPRNDPPAGRAAMAPGDRSGLLTAAPNMLALLERVDALSRSDAPVFITGEVGVGKSLVARRLHDTSPRASAAFVAVDCALLTPADVEERFREFCERARGGTLFLDEVATLDPDVQPRVLSRIAAATDTGAAANAPRIVSAMSRDPHGTPIGERLRPDLFYRLHVAPIAIPPLRERPSDIALIAHGKLAEFARIEGRRVTGISDAAMALFRAHDWPGNVRELLNVIRSALAMHDVPEILPEHLPPEITSPPLRSAPAPQGLAPLIGQSLAAIEQAVIEATIRAEGGSIPHAARVLDVAPSTLYRKRDTWQKRAKDARR
jgi:DNA-binding NtrC family response regulator